MLSPLAALPRAGSSQPADIRATKWELMHDALRRRRLSLPDSTSSPSPMRPGFLVNLLDTRASDEPETNGAVALSPPFIFSIRRGNNAFHKRNSPIVPLSQNAVIKTAELRCEKEERPQQDHFQAGSRPDWTRECGPSAATGPPVPVDRVPTVLLVSGPGKRSGAGCLEPTMEPSRAQRCALHLMQWVFSLSPAV